jgi:hypothetical protein
VDTFLSSIVGVEFRRGTSDFLPQLSPPPTPQNYTISYDNYIGIMPPNHKTPDNDDEEEDYMSMIIQEPATQQRETLTQRKLRKQREVSAPPLPPSSISQKIFSTDLVK